MTGPKPLDVPAPAIGHTAIEGGRAPIGEPVTVRFGAVRFPDGTAVADTDLIRAAALLFRWMTPAGPPEVWNLDKKAWHPAPADLARLDGLTLEYKDKKDGSEPAWEGKLAAGVKDGDGQPQFAPAVDHFPQYRLRGAFRARRGNDEYAGRGAEGSALEFISRSSLGLAVPIPSIEPASGIAAIEGEAAVRLGAVQFPDGTAVKEEDLVRATALLFRWSAPASSAEVWNGAAKAWQPAPGSAEDLMQLTGIPLQYQAGPPPVWQGLVLATGAKDAAGNPQFSPAAGHYPKYRLRGAFQARRAGVEYLGMGADSPALEFFSGAADARFGLQLTPPAPAPARNAKLLLRDAAMQVVGSLEIDAGGVITIANSAAGTALATVTLAANGDITLAPAATGKVIVAGDLQTGRINFVPYPGGTRKDLV